jgi:hypothetical protein
MLLIKLSHNLFKVFSWVFGIPNLPHNNLFIFLETIYPVIKFEPLMWVQMCHKIIKRVNFLMSTVIEQQHFFLVLNCTLIRIVI